MSPSSTTQPGSEWQLEFARLIGIPEEPLAYSDQTWWQDVTSTAPDDHVSIRKRHTQEDRGSFGGANLSLLVSPNKIEWLVQPGADSDAAPGGLPTLGPFRAKLDWFVDLTTHWLNTARPTLARLVFSGKLLRVTSSHADAYRYMETRLPCVKSLQINSIEPNDFALYVNRRRPSRVVENLEINRVSTWSRLNFSIIADPKAEKKFTWPRESYVALEFDINTAPEWPNVLPRELLSPLFKELVDLGIEIADRGDCL